MPLQQTNVAAEAREATPILLKPNRLLTASDPLQQQQQPLQFVNYQSDAAVGNAEMMALSVVNNMDNDFAEASPAMIYSGHCHRNVPTMTDTRAKRALVISALLCLLFMTVELLGGYLAASLAIVTDAAHLLTDLASFLISLFSMYMASRRATKKLSFGWHRAEVLGALTSVILIWLITGVLVYIAVERIVYKDYNIDAKIMLITALLGVLFNLIMAGVLYRFGAHGHSHGGHQHDNINVRAALIHVLGDFIQSIGVFVAALIIFLRPDLMIVDPICTFLFSLLVLATTIRIMRDVVNVLMEGSPSGIDFSDVIGALGHLQGVAKVHDLRIWSLTMDKTAVSVHLAIYSDGDGQDILERATVLLRQQYGVYECTVQVERFSEDMDDCVRCLPPYK